VPRLLLVKYDQIPGRCLQVSIIFLRFVVWKIWYSNFWVDTQVLKEVHWHYLIFG
jgi:hypothetical protein